MGSLPPSRVVLTCPGPVAVTLPFGSSPGPLPALSSKSMAFSKSPIQISKRGLRWARFIVPSKAVQF